MSEKKPTAKPQVIKKDPHEEMLKHCTRVQKDTTQIRVRNEKVLNEIRKYVERGEIALKAFAERTQNLEDSLLMVMHNIKKNQFLYSHYPEEWVKNYRDVKKGIKFENDYMEKIAK